MSSDAYKLASWKWLMAEGGVPHYYGGYKTHGRSYDNFVHVRGCGIDVSKSSDISTGFEDEFDNTFTEHNLQVEAVKGYVTCKCGEVQSLELCIKREFTMGEMIEKVLSYDGNE